MPKMTDYARLKRWFDLDSELSQSMGFQTTVFAKQSGVNVRTIKRDLELFRRIGRKIDRIVIEGQKYTLAYSDKRGRMFRPPVPG